MCDSQDPQTNIDFYTNVLGLRLMKLTVNFRPLDVSFLLW
jgi:catechol 2,3-dioxygenase-like lactoylglutathione lyase family enzyme